MRILHKILLASLLHFFIYIEFSFAARPFNTDDANIVGKNQCQLETWIAAYKDQSSEIWALPSCNFFWDIEIGLGGMMGLKTRLLQFQVKKLFVDTSKKGWGIGVTIGNTYNYLDIGNHNNNIYFYIPATIELLDARFIWHINAGYNIQSFRDSIWTLGIGMEVALTPNNIYIVGEVYYVRFDPIIYQIGLRTWLIKDILQLDSTYGNTFYGKNHFVSLGFRILTEKLL